MKTLSKEVGELAELSAAPEEEARSKEVERSPTFSADRYEYFKPPKTTPDAEDWEFHKAICDAALVTQRLRELVPLLEFVGCVVDEIGPYKTVISLPLLETAMNQNGTHQASIFYLVADYVLGSGMIGALPGTYVTGVHDRCHALPVQLWLKKGEVVHLAPGIGPIRAEVQIPPEEAQKLRNQLIAKGRGELSGTVKFYQENQIIAEARHTMGIYADVPRLGGTRLNMFQTENVKTSALMIAGLRQDPISAQIAGEQGKAIANRMALAAPQLPSLVRARTIDVERHMVHGREKYRQVLALGIGLDPKPIMFSRSGQAWFGLDLRDMLGERKQRFSQIVEKADPIIPVPANLLSSDWPIALLASGFDPKLSTLIVMEGLSMYFSSEELQGIFRSVAELTQSDASRVWLDHVTPKLFELDLEEVRSFLSTMERLGEPFITGFDDPASTAPGWSLSETTTASAVVGINDEIHSEYRFSILKPSGLGQAWCH